MGRDCCRQCGCTSMRRSKRWRIVHLALCLLILIHSQVGTYFVQAERSPYHVLGVSRDSSQQEIKKCYKSLCLKFHPDKNVNKTTREKARCEARFKEIQNAYSLIGDEQSRSSYDLRNSFSYSKQPSSYSFPHRHGSDPVTEAFFSAFRTPFPSTSSHHPTEHMVQMGASFKSIYHQKVFVPLDKLFTGAEYQFELVDNLWTRYRAAIRGKTIFFSLYQGFICSFPIFRTSRILAAIVGLFIVHLTLPKPSPRKTFPVTLPRGSKGKTKVKFPSITLLGQADVIFELQEAPHENYARVGNDLHTSVPITYEEADQGCKKAIPALDPTQAPIQIDIPSDGQISHGDIIRIKGEGWPIKNAPGVFSKGDLIVEIVIVPTSRKLPRRCGRYKIFKNFPRTKR